MKSDSITEASTQTHVGLPAPFEPCFGSGQPTVITLPAVEPKRVGRAEISSFEEDPDCNLACCPQGSDCAGESVPRRLFDCEEGCGFRGCGACMEIHESEPHASDSDVRLAMVRDIGGLW